MGYFEGDNGMGLTALERSYAPGSLHADPRTANNGDNMLAFRVPLQDYSFNFGDAPLVVGILITIRMGDKLVFFTLKALSDKGMDAVIKALVLAQGLAIAPLVTAAKARIAAEEAACTAFYAKHGAPATWDTKDPTRPAPPRNFNKWYIALPPDAAVCRAYNALWGKPQRGKLPPQPPHKYQEWLALPAKRR